MNKQQKRDKNNVQILIDEQVKMNSTNHPALNVRVFIAPLVEHCCANAVTSDGSNPVESLAFFNENDNNNNNKFPGFSYENA